MSNSLWPYGLKRARLPCRSPTPGAYSNSSPLSWWCHPAISSSVIPFSCCLQSFPVSGSFQMSQFFTSGGRSIGASASASVLPMNIQDWSLEWTGWICLQSKGLSRVFSNTTVHIYTNNSVYLMSITFKIFFSFLIENRSFYWEYLFHYWTASTLVLCKIINLFVFN